MKTKRVEWVVEFKEMKSKPWCCDHRSSANLEKAEHICTMYDKLDCPTRIIERTITEREVKRKGKK